MLPEDLETSVKDLNCGVASPLRHHVFSAKGTGVFVDTWKLDLIAEILEFMFESRSWAGVSKLALIWKSHQNARGAYE